MIDFDKIELALVEWTDTKQLLKLQFEIQKLDCDCDEWSNLPELISVELEAPCCPKCCDCYWDRMYERLV